LATSGTVGSTIFTNQQIIDHAFRRCKMVEQEITGEHLEIALDLMWMFCMTLVNRGIKLWNIDAIILPLYEAEQTVPLPLGTEDILNINLRTQTRITGTATATEGVADNAFDSDLTTACTQVAPDGSITMTLTSAQALRTFGILPNVSAATPTGWSYVIEASNDGFVTSTTFITRTDSTVVAGEWLWFDVQGVTAFDSWRLRAFGGVTVLDVIEMVYQTTPQEIPFYSTLNRTDYSNLPDKTSLGRPTQLWYDRQRTIPQLEIWPSPQFQFTFAQITGFVQSQMQDVGTMTDELEVPDRWYLAIVCQLAKQLAREIKEVREELIPRIDADAQLYLDDAWTGEGDGSDTFWRPNISPYTR
jgi:hypothetical protein